MENLPFDLANGDWGPVIQYAVIAFLAALVGNAISFGNKLFGAILTGVFFAVFFVLWTYWFQAMVDTPAATPPV